MYKSVIFICLIAFGYDTAVSAQGLDVALSLQRQRQDLEFSGDVRDTRQNSLDIVWKEPLHARLTGSIQFGYLEIHQANNPVVAAQITDGGYLGIGMHVLLLDSPSFQIVTDLNYRYHETDSQLDNQVVQWRWHQGQLGLFGHWRVSPYLGLSLGSSAIWVDGTERLTGTINQLNHFDARNPYSGHLGIRFYLDHTGSIGIELNTGSLQGGQVTFQRAF